MERPSAFDMDVGAAATTTGASVNGLRAAFSPDPILAGFIANLRQARREAGMTQEALAEACGMERTYISYLERGQAEPKLRMIVRLAGGLQMSPADLLKGLAIELLNTV